MIASEMPKGQSTEKSSQLRQQPSESAGSGAEGQKAEETPLTVENLYKSLYNDTPAMPYSIDRSGRLVSVSKPWLDALGYTREEVIGRRSTGFLTEDSHRDAKRVRIPEFYKTGFVKDVPYKSKCERGRVLTCPMQMG